jgi:hypothetical protein
MLLICFWYVTDCRKSPRQFRPHLFCLTLYCFGFFFQNPSMSMHSEVVYDMNDVWSHIQAVVSSYSVYQTSTHTHTHTYTHAYVSIRKKQCQTDVFMLSGKMLTTYYSCRCGYVCTCSCKFQQRLYSVFWRNLFMLCFVAKSFFVFFEDWPLLM